jgi:hypothetical protein
MTLNLDQKVANLERRKFEGGCPSGSCHGHSKFPIPNGPPPLPAPQPPESGAFLFILVLPTVGFSHVVSRKWASPDWYYNSGRMIRLFNVRGNSKFACWAAVFTPPSPFSPDRVNRPPPNRLRVGTLLTQPPVLWCRLGSSPATAREHSSHAAA